MTPLEKFTQQKAFAHFEGKWRTCHYAKCRNKRKCTGGARGAFRRNKGVPACKLSDQGVIGDNQQSENGEIDKV